METKDRILVKSQELFSKYGIRSVSMDDIASQLGISKKTVYQFYTDKNELVDAVFSSIMEYNKCQCLVCQNEGENAIDEVFKSFDSVQELLANMHPSVLFDLQKYHPTAYKKFDDYRNHFLFRMIKQNLEQGIEQGVYRDDIDVDIMAKYRLYSIMLSFDSSVFPSNKTDLLYIEEQLLDNFLHGVATPKGIKLIQKYKNQRTK
jgi:TetR/AcrR family transcriptional regulator, cholesterol catabolism regulator